MRVNLASLTFPCDPRYLTTVRDAVATAVMGQGFDNGRTAAALAKVEPFLQGCLKASNAPISIEVSDTQLMLASADRTLTVDL
jgi:hypothetical protein